MKKLSVAVLSATLITTPAFAENGANYSTLSPNNQLANLNAVFDNSDNLQVAVLSEKEMKETEGAVVPFVAAALMGGAISAWGNHAINYSKTGQLASVDGTIKATASGMVVGASVYGAGRALKPVVGTPQNWIRVGDSYSKSQQIQTVAVRWGSNKYYQKQIGNATLRDLNNKLHESKLPGNSWRVQDKGHFHLKKK